MTKNATHYKAVLKFGETYYLGPAKEFKRGKPEVITAAEKARLSRQAVDLLTVTHGNEKSTQSRCKFVFEPCAAPAPRKSKAEELAEMQGDGGVEGYENDEDADEGDADNGDADGEEEGSEEGEANDEAPAPRTRGRNPPANRTRNRRNK